MAINSLLSYYFPYSICSMLSAGLVLLQSKPQILRLSDFSAYIAVRYFVIVPGFLFSIAPVSPYVFHLLFLYLYIFAFAIFVSGS